MPERLPVPGQDNGTWGQILNQYLEVEHESDGTLKIRTDGTLSAKANDSDVVHVTGSEMVNGVKTFLSSPVVPTPSSGTQAANKTYVDTTAAAGTPDADAVTKGKLQLAGDLSGTASTPAVAAGAIDNSKIAPLANIDQSKLNLAITDSQVAVGAAIAQTKISSLTTDLGNKQPLDSDLTTIAGLSPSNDDIIQRKAGAWTNRTLAQLKTDLAVVYSKTITIESPTSSENITLFHTDFAITIIKVHAVVRGTTPSVTFQIPHGSDRSAGGTDLFSSGQSITSTTTGTEYTSFNDATLVADEIAWLTTSATSGTVSELAVTIYYTIN